MTVDVTPLLAAAKAATPGKWQWFGNTKMHEVYLATVDRGRTFVMDFVRWGMAGAQPRFQVRLDDRPGSGIMRCLGDLAASEHALGPKFEATYRRQFTGIGHPDAEYIAAASPDVITALCEEVLRLREVERLANAYFDAADAGATDSVVIDGEALRTALARAKDPPP